MNDFVSKEPREYNFRLGRQIASSLSGFIAGVLVASIIWGAALYFALVF